MHQLHPQTPEEQAYNLEVLKRVLKTFTLEQLHNFLAEIKKHNP